MSNTKARFGLNQGTLDKFQLSATNAGKAAMQINFKVGEKVFYGGFVIQSADHFESGEKYQEYRKAVLTDLLHIYAAFGDTNAVKNTLRQRNYATLPIEEICKIFINAMPLGFDRKKLHIFMQWQYKIPQGQTKTFLEPPSLVAAKNWIKAASADGAFVTAEIDGNWEEVRSTTGEDDEIGLEYINSLNNVSHPFTRSVGFLKSKVGSRQGEGTIDERKTTAGATTPQVSKGAALLDDLITHFGQAEVYQALFSLIDSALGVGTASTHPAPRAIDAPTGMMDNFLDDLENL